MVLKQFLGLGVIALAVVLVSGCNSSVPKEDSTLPNVPEASNDPNDANYNGAGSMGKGAGFGEDANGWKKNADDSSVNGAVDADGWRLADPTGNRLNMPIIYFAYDSDVLVPTETANLDRIAKYLSDKPELGLLIEGHCDQRGTEEYNRALGERRANAIRSYLAGKGLADGRMKTISYGKDKPAVTGEGESVWRQNRRGVPVPMVIPAK